LTDRESEEAARSCNGFVPLAAVVRDKENAMRIASIVVGVLLLLAGAGCFYLSNQAEHSAVKWDEEATQMRADIAAGKRPKEFFGELPAKMDQRAEQQRHAAQRWRIGGGGGLGLGVVFCVLPVLLRRRKPVTVDIPADTPA
jgi:hypothetical protein